MATQHLGSPQQSVDTAKENIKKIDDSNFVFRISHNDTLSPDGLSLVSESGKSVELPTQAVDKTGQQVRLLYSNVPGTDGQVVRIQVLTEDAAKEVISHNAQGTVVRADYWKCPVGTDGSVIGGGLTGAAAGATIGSVLPKVGTAAGWVIGGAIGGAIGGGGVGAATFC